MVAVVAMVEVVVVEVVEMVEVVTTVTEVPCPMPYYLYSFKLVDECKPMSKQMQCFVF